MQLYCPFAESPYHRTLFIYTCVNRLCWGKNSSWKVLREQNLDESFTPAASNPMPVDSQKDIWGDGDDDWGDEDGDEQSSSDSKSMADVEGITAMIDGNFNLNAAEPESSLTPSSETGKEMPSVEEAPEFASSSEMDAVYMEDTSALSEESVSRLLKLMAPSQNTVVDEQPNVNRAALCSYYLNVFEDNGIDASSTRHVKVLLDNYSKKEGKTFQKMLTTVKTGQEISGNGEDYEKDDVKYKDESFYKFHKTVSYWPEQCVRYDLGGMAVTLLPDHLQVGVCSHCGSDRQFELQLMPALISALTFPDSQDYAVEFGTILIFTCKRSCWDEDTSVPRIEHCIVQCEKEQFLLQ